MKKQSGTYLCGQCGQLCLFRHGLVNHSNRYHQGVVDEAETFLSASRELGIAWERLVKEIVNQARRDARRVQRAYANGVERIVSVLGSDTAFFTLLLLVGAILGIILLFFVWNMIESYPLYERWRDMK